jgi:hypothetical protein
MGKVVVNVASQKSNTKSGQNSRLYRFPKNEPSALTAEKGTVSCLPPM